MTEQMIRQAVSTSIGACDFCPSVHINLLDDSGEVFATAVVPLHTVEPLVQEIRNVAKERARFADAPMRRQ